MEFLGEEKTEPTLSRRGHAASHVVGQARNLAKRQTMASSGFVTQMTKAFGQYFLMPAPTAFITLALTSIRSSRLMPGLRGAPAVTMTTSAPFRSAWLVVPEKPQLNPSIGEDWAMSRALP